MQDEEITKESISLNRVHYLLHPFNATLVTCKGKDGKINVLTVAWIIPVSVNPPLLAMSIRPERHSFNLIAETGEFVVNIPTFDLAQKVLFCGRKSGRNYDKFKEVSLTPQKAKKVGAPLIAECIAHLECKVAKTVEAGDHTLFIGHIVEASASKTHFKDVYDLTTFRPCLHVGKNFFTTCVQEIIEPKV